MLKRTLTALVGIAILIPVVIFSNTWFLNVSSSIMVSIAVYEILNCIGALKKPMVSVPAFAVALVPQILSRLLDAETCLSVMLMVYMGFFVALMTVAVFSHGNVKFGTACISAVMVAYVSFGFLSLILLRDSSESTGLVLFVLALIIPWVCDITAYFVGVLFGKHKMIPDVSPKKTVEGAIGGVAGVVIAAAIYGMIMQFGFGKMPNYPLLLVIALVGGLVSQWGDLIASLLKREYGIKDYGKIFPGHGGVMDRFDSLFAVAIFIYIVFRIFAAHPLFLS